MSITIEAAMAKAELECSQDKEIWEKMSKDQQKDCVNRVAIWYIQFEKDVRPTKLPPHCIHQDTFYAWAYPPNDPGLHRIGSGLPLRFVKDLKGFKMSPAEIEKWKKFLWESEAQVRHERKLGGGSGKYKTDKGGNFVIPRGSGDDDDEEEADEEQRKITSAGGSTRSPFTRSQSGFSFGGAPEPEAEVDFVQIPLSVVKEQASKQGIALFGRTDSDEVRAEEAPRMKEEIAKFKEDNKEQKQEIEDLHRVNKEQQAQVEKATEELRAIKEQAKSLFSLK
jgi:hypothetical protein